MPLSLGLSVRVRSKAEPAFGSVTTRAVYRVRNVQISGVGELVLNQYFFHTGISDWGRLKVAQIKSELLQFM